MTALIVVGSILLFLLLLLLSPVVLRFSYHDGAARVSAQYLFILFDFSPEAAAERAEQKAKRAVKDEYKKQKKEGKAKAKKTEAASDTVKTVWALLKASRRALNILRRHLVFYKIRLNITVGGEDAHDIATAYGNMCALVSNGLSVLDSLFVVREPEVSIQADFLAPKTVYEARFRLRISPLFVVSAALVLLLRFIKVRNENKIKREKVKGGKHHEPANTHQ